MCPEMDPRARTHPAISKMGCQSAGGGWGARTHSRPSREALRQLGRLPSQEAPALGLELRGSPVPWGSVGLVQVPKQPCRQPHSGSCGVQQGPERRVAWNTPPPPNSPPHPGTGSPGVLEPAFHSLFSHRRAMKRNTRLRCPFRKGTCEITRKTRRQCQACRLRKCLESGMKKESEQREGPWAGAGWGACAS